MSKRIATSDWDKRFEDHHRLLARGLVLHEARQYTKALNTLRKAADAWPMCEIVNYNIANVCYMLNRNDEAFLRLQGLISKPDRRMEDDCCDVNARSLKLDAYYLLFLLVRDWKGPCAEALAYAREHLKRRSRGLGCLWSIREVRQEVRLAEAECDKQAVIA